MIEIPRAISFTELIRRTRNELLSVYEHQNVRLSQITRLVRRRTAIQHMVSLLPAMQLRSTTSDVSVSQIFVEPTRFDLDLYMAITEVRSGFEVGWAYNAVLFDERFVESLGSHFTELLEQGLATPTATVYIPSGVAAE